MKVIVNMSGMRENGGNRHRLGGMRRLWVAIEVDMRKQRVSFFCAKFRIYSFIDLILKFEKADGKIKLQWD